MENESEPCCNGTSMAIGNNQSDLTKNSPMKFRDFNKKSAQDFVQQNSANQKISKIVIHKETCVANSSATNNNEISSNDDYSECTDEIVNALAKEKSVNPLIRDSM